MSGDINFHSYLRTCKTDKSNLDNDKSYLVVVYGVTDSLQISHFKTLWAKYDTTKKAVGRDEKNTLRVEHEHVGGALTVFDPLKTGSESLLIDILFPNPFMTLFSSANEEMFVTAGFKIISFKNGKIYRTLTNNQFNGIHGISLSDRGLLVCSTSIDLILEIGPDKPDKILWYWSAVESGLNITPRGEFKSYDSSVNYSKLGTIGSSHHTTHVNSAIEYDSEHVLATLFHQDQLIKINKSSKKYEVVLDDLTNPHFIRRTKNGFMVCDTRGGRVIFLDKQLKKRSILQKPHFDWVQDAVEFDKFIAVANDNKNKIDIYDRDYKMVNQIGWLYDSRMISSLGVMDGKQIKNAFYE